MLSHIFHFILSMVNWGYWVQARYCRTHMKHKYTAYSYPKLMTTTLELNNRCRRCKYKSVAKYIITIINNNKYRSNNSASNTNLLHLFTICRWSGFFTFLVDRYEIVNRYELSSNKKLCTEFLTDAISIYSDAD